MTLDWQDGQPYSAEFGDVYFSSDSGLQESRHVFLAGNDLEARFAALGAGQVFAIGETGFGTGLNFLLAWEAFERCAPADASLDFFSVEKFPLEEAELAAALALWPDLRARADALCRLWRRRVPGWNRWTLGRVRLTLAIGDVAEALPQLPEVAIDAWFLDGFSPAKNPQMWQPEVLAAVFRATRPGGSFATFTCAGWVRRNLQAAGFEVARVPGFGRKREMARGCKSAAAPVPRAVRPARALVIGGGIAGCAMAWALTQRGVAVTLIESGAGLAGGGSGNPRGILHARFSAGMNPLHRFVLASYGHALAWLDAVLPVDGIWRDECGVLQLACTEQEAVRIEKLGRMLWPASLLQTVSAQQASRLAGLEMTFGGAWFPAAGWLVPALLCERLLLQSGVIPRCGHTATDLQRVSSGWLVSGRDAQGMPWQQEADQVVLCCAHDAARFVPAAGLHLTPVRGQVSVLAATQASTALRTVVCGDGYCVPARDGQHLIGATHAFDDISVELRAADHDENLRRLAAYAPVLHAALGPQVPQQGRAAVRCSAPGAMPLVGELAAGLQVSLAHGTRGLLTAGLAAEWLASQLCGTLPPLPADIGRALSPTRRGAQRRPV